LIIVTGAAGFIGANVVKALNDAGRVDVIAVDDLTHAAKMVNLRDLQIADYLDITELKSLVENNRFANTKITAICHQGACSDTTEQNGRYMLENNFAYSRLLLHFAFSKKIPFVYASSAATYGASTTFTETPANEKPLNVYGYSKLLFDQYVRQRVDQIHSTVVGLRYFNVYGPREQHKGRMSSTIYHFHKQIEVTGTAKLFEGADGYGPGEQRRDFVFVGDVVKANLFFLLSEMFRQGVANVGTGKSRTFNDVANVVIAQHEGKGRIEYVPFPADLAGKYQSYTQADLTELRKLGYTEPFTELEDGVAQAIEWYRTNA
jgi:ADP-L-glycero-D-manno-heptose 6-epimerase